MTGLPLIHRKLTPPRLPAHLVTRRALHASLQAGLEPGKLLTLVCGGPGYGKSTLAAAYGRELALPLAWYSLEESDGDLGTFLAYLDGALRRVIPALPRRGADLARSAPSVEGVSQTVVGLIAEDLAETGEGGGLLVLDDLHAVAGVPAIVQAVEHLARYLPDDWQLLVTSRELPAALPLGQLRVRQQLVEIGVRDLRFNASELRELVQGLAGLSLSNADCLDLLGHTDGWAASVILAAQAVQGVSGDARASLFRELDHPAALFDYLAQEVLGRQDEGQQRFLLDTAPLPHLEVEVCREALGLPDAAERIKRLVHAQLVFQVEAGDGPAEAPIAWAYQPTFRRFLLNRLHETRTSAEVKALCARLGAALGDSQPEEGLALLLRGEATMAAEALAVRVAEQLLAHNQLDRLRAMLERFPAEHRVGSAALCLYLGEIHRLWGEFDEASELFERCGLPEVRDSEAWRGRAAIHLAAVRIGRQDPRAEATLTEGERLCPPHDLRARGFAQNLRGALAFGAQDLASAVACYEASLACHRQLADPVGQARALVNLGLCHTRFGRFEAAIATCLEAVAQSEAAGRVPPPMTFNNLAAIYTYQGRHAEAWGAAERAMELARLLRSRRDQLFAEIALGAIALAQGDGRRAASHFETAREGASHLQDRATTAKAHVALAEVALLQHGPAEAQFQLDAAVSLTGYPLEDPRAQDTAIAQVAVWLAAGEPDRATPLLGSLQVACAELGYRYRGAQLAYYAARLKSLQGLPGEQVEAAWAEADELAEANGFDHLAAEELARRGPARTKPTGAPTPEKPPAGAGVAPVIRIDTLGGLRVRVGEREVQAREWRGFKTKLILAYLLVHPEGVTKEALTDMLYGETDTTRTATLVLISRLRHALEPDLAGGGSSRFIHFVDGRYSFNFALPYVLDAEELDYHLKEGGDGRQDLEIRRHHWRQAIALYGGPYLADLTADAAWLTIERERHHRRIQEAHTALMRACLGDHDLTGALDAAESNLAFDPCCEHAHRVKMHVLAELGQREQALRHYQVMKQVLARELGLTPSAASESLSQAIARGAAPVLPEL